MKILLLSPWMPWPPFDGGRIRVLETLRHLSRSHRVTLAGHLGGPDELDGAGELRELCEQIVAVTLPTGTRHLLPRLARGMLRGSAFIESFHFDDELSREIGRLTAAGDFDVIQVEFSFLSRYLDAVAPGTRAKKVLAMHNVESVRFARELAHSPWSARRLMLLGDRALFSSWEEKAVRRFDGIVCTSGAEVDWARKHAPGADVRLVPNGVDVGAFRAAGGPVDSDTLVFTGMMSYPPNVDAVTWFCDEILPRLRRDIPGLSFKIVGSRPSPAVVALGERPGVVVTGRVDDVRPHVSGALALVVPLRSGGGTRLKILEAMALERPVISTPLGAEGLEVTPNENVLLAEDAETFLRHVHSLRESEGMAARLGAAGRALVVERYDWTTCLRGLDDLYAALGAAAPRAHP